MLPEILHYFVLEPPRVGLGSRSVAFSKNSIFAQEKNGRVVVTDKETGRAIKEFPLGNEFWNPMLAVSNGIITSDSKKKSTENQVLIIICRFLLGRRRRTPPL